MEIHKLAQDTLEGIDINYKGDNWKQVNALISFPWHIDFKPDTTDEQKNAMLDPLWREHLAKLDFTPEEIEEFIEETHKPVDDKIIQSWMETASRYLMDKSITTMATKYNQMLNKLGGN